MNHSGLLEGYFGNVGFVGGVCFGLRYLSIRANGIDGLLGGLFDGCGFMVYGLVQWIRDAQPKTARRHEDSQAPDRKQPHIVSSHKTSGSGRSLGVSTEGELVNGEQGPGRLSSRLRDSEDIVHRRIASFVIPRKKT